MIALAENLYITVKEVCMVKIYDNPAVCLQDTEGISSHLSKFCSSGVIKNCQLPLVEFMARTLVSSALASHVI
jgi:hypothetical protein